MNKEFDLQLFAAETGMTAATDLEPAISIDLASRLSENIKTLQNIISTNELIPMSSGTLIKMYETKISGNVAEQVGEGEVIGLTKIERKLKKTEEITLKKYRKQTSAEAIQEVGRSTAVNSTDEALIKGVQKEIKSNFFAMLGTGTGKATPKAAGLQAALAAAWGAVQKKFEDTDVTPIFFVSTDDISDYLATAQISLQTTFGLSYVENFLGLGDAFVSPSVPAGTVTATAKENLKCAYVPADNSDVAVTFGLESDETGLVGMTHTLATDRACVDTLVMAGVKFFPEDLSAVIKATVSTGTAAGE